MHDNRRTSTRHSVDLAVTLAVNESEHEARIRNLSLGGAYIALEGLAAGASPAMGDRVSVAFRVPTQDDVIRVGAAVRWTTDGGIGVQFDGLRAREVWSLNKYFESL